MVNLVLGFWPSLNLRVEVGSGEGVRDNLVRSDNGCKNGGEKGGSLPGFWNRPSDELRCMSGGMRCGCDCKYRCGFR